MSKFKTLNWLPILSNKYPVRRFLFLSYFLWETFIIFYLKQQEIVEYLDTSFLIIFLVQLEHNLQEHSSYRCPTRQHWHREVVLEEHFLVNEEIQQVIWLRTQNLILPQFGWDLLSRNCQPAFSHLFKIDFFFLKKKKKDSFTPIQHQLSGF